MVTRTSSPLLQDAVRHFMRAMHATYPEIATTGVRPPQPGTFIGDIAEQHVRLVPGARNSRLFLVKERTKGRMAYFRYGFDLFKKGAAPRWDFGDDEARLVLWLVNATADLERLADE